jgi:hypothetical protein
MHRNDRLHTSRRSLFHAILGAGIATALGRESRRALAAPEQDRKLLFVVAMAGGASIVDSFLPVAASEAGSKANSLVAYPDEALGERGGLRYVKKIDGTDPLGKFSSDYDLGTFLDRHGSDTAVVTQEVTSVNHVVAQKRAVTGANVNGGRTLMEAAAAVHGAGLALPNCNFATGGYAEPGTDASIPDRARAEVISDPLYFPLATDASRGIRGGLSRSLLEHARDVRAAFEARSPFLTRYGKAKMLEAFRSRREAARAIEDADLLSKLMLLPEGEIELSDYDLESSPMLAKMVEVFPNLARGDAMEAQAAIGLLLARHGIAASITLGPSFVPSFLDSGKIVDTPLAFDYSHTDHVTAQNVMWRRMMQVVDGLVTLLKEEDYLSDASLGPMWDRSLVYLATDFGRTKDRPSGSTSFGSGHDLSNGNVIVSPLVRGGRVYGGVDPTTVKTYGFDPTTGEPDPSRLMREGDVYSLVAQALGVEFGGRTDMSGLVR